MTRPRAFSTRDHDTDRPPSFRIGLGLSGMGRTSPAILVPWAVRGQERRAAEADPGAGIRGDPRADLGPAPVAPGLTPRPCHAIVARPPEGAACLPRVDEGRSRSAGGPSPRVAERGNAYGTRIAQITNEAWKISVGARERERAGS
jgi:hypothetical protein